jgi:preprotein translocase subunit YajC
MIGTAGLLITWYYKHKADRRHMHEHELRMERLRRGQRVDTDLGELGEDE